MIAPLEQASPVGNGIVLSTTTKDAMDFRTWCEVNDFSPATGRRLRKAGTGPTFTQLSARRIG